MSCETYDWKAYVLGELAGKERREAEAHAVTCEGCRGELAHVRLTIHTLSALREEEVPRRIAFVSDKVFEPRWWQMFRRQALFSPMFAAGLVIAAAIVMHGYLMRPAADGAIQARIDQAVNLAVANAVANVEQRNMDAVNKVDGKVTDLYVATTGIKYQ